MAGDLFAALGSLLMFWLACIMLRDGMQELSKYACVYAMLCSMNFFFDLLYLVTEFPGRIESTTQAHQMPVPGGANEVVYTVKSTKTPMFDATMGLMYNLQSLALILAPLTYGLGLYLSWSAHQEIEQQWQGMGPLTLNAGDFADIAAGGPPLPTAQPASSQEPSANQRDRRARQEPALQPFQGRSYKLDEADDVKPALAPAPATLEKPEEQPELRPAPVAPVAG